MHSKILLLICYNTVMFGQLPFTEHKIANFSDGDGEKTIHASDLDRDGDIDILSSTTYDDKIYWYKNNGSQGFTKLTIATNTYDPSSIFTIDLDQDGDIDVLSGAHNETYPKVAWHKNDGNENFSSYTISSDKTESVYAIDLDQDGDIDVIAADPSTGVIWHENNGSQSFTRTVVSAPIGEYSSGSSTFYLGSSVFAIDLDSDGDNDILATHRIGGQVVWYENDGAANPSFTANNIGSENGVNSIYAIDLDQDGDMDVLTANGSDSKVRWYENDGAANPSFTAHIIATNLWNTLRVHAIDMDGDGDLDVTSVGYSDKKIAWFENDGSQNFSYWFINNLERPYGSYPIDVDSDGDMDLVTSGKEAVAWYENTMDKGMIGSWTAADIATSADGANSVFAADMDNDG
ncbi:VCBS repeat-containing protein, partial [Candidatus Marinimicrobia bacterium]|nr:VCBS repeat-containing protein [Candidatus Neomarinimicrobiota bacterium]